MIAAITLSFADGRSKNFHPLFSNVLQKGTEGPEIGL